MFSKFFSSVLTQHNYDFCLFVIQYCAEVAYDMISPGPSVRKKKYRRKLRRLTHPADLREGFSNAYHVVTEVSCVIKTSVYRRSSLNYLILFVLFPTEVVIFVPSRFMIRKITKKYNNVSNVEHTNYR